MSSWRSSSSSQSSPTSARADWNAAGSTSALILIQDSDNSSNASFDSSDDENDLEPQLDSVRQTSLPRLSPSAVFLYLLSPFLKLGAPLVLGNNLPLRLGIPCLVFFAALSAFSRSIWYLLAKYTRKADMEDIVVDAFARGRGKERQRALLRSMIRFCTGFLRLLLATAYLRESGDALLVLIPEYIPFPPRLVIIPLLALVVLPLSAVQTLADKRIKYATFTSVVAYVLWLGSVSYLHAKDTLEVSVSLLHQGILWQGITATAFAFASPSTLLLYSSLRGTAPPLPVTTKTSKPHSFIILSFLSCLFAVLLILPLTFFSSYSHETPDVPSQPVIVIAHALLLILGIPSILVSTPSLPIPPRIRNATNIPLSICIIWFLALLLSLVPPAMYKVITDILLVMALVGTYVLPAIVHIATHHFKRPLSIVVPSTPAYTSSPRFSRPASPSHDELLQRKEHALQRKQLRKRIIWDIGVWILLVPVGGGGFIWAIGRILGKW